MARPTIPSGGVLRVRHVGQQRFAHVGAEFADRHFESQLGASSHQHQEATAIGEEDRSVVVLLHGSGIELGGGRGLAPSRRDTRQVTLTHAGLTGTSEEYRPVATPGAWKRALRSEPHSSGQHPRSPTIDFHRFEASIRRERELVAAG